MLGGNAETMALDEIKKYLRHEVENRVQKGEMDERVAHDYIDHMIYEANGHADTDDQEVLAIRAKFEELYSTPIIRIRVNSISRASEKEKLRST